MVQTKFKSNDPLQHLLREALHQQRATRSRKTAPSHVPQGPDPFDLYQASAWKPGRELVLVIHSDQFGTETIIGLFSEQINPRAHGSRLIPVSEEIKAKTLKLSDIPRNYVHGDHWLQPKVKVSYTEAPDEAAEITRRFHELLSTFD